MLANPFYLEFCWQTFAEYYPFLSNQDVDWAGLHQEYVTQVHSQVSEEDLFEIITDMLSGFDDDHISLSADSDNLSEEFSTESLSTYLEYALARVVEDDGDDISSYYIELIAEFTDKLEQAYGQTEFKHYVYADAINVMTWGELAGNIGYLQINAMQFYADAEEATDIEELEAAIAVMKLALSDLANTEKLIIDIRFNRGGYDPISLAFASHFSEQAGVAYNRQVNGQSLRPQSFIAEHNKSYQKPIELIINDGTQSGAEVFGLAMSELPNVTIYGEQSAGHLANMTDVILAPDWELSLPSEIIKAADGSDVEGVGIVPEYLTETNNLTEHQQGIFETIAVILNK